MLGYVRDWGRLPKLPDEKGRFRCSKCRDWKEPSKFSRNKSQLTGLNYACKSCMRKDSRKYNLPAKYGITVERFAEMLLSQDGKCACCFKQFDVEGKSFDRPCVDHNHTSGQVRDLLCGRCNLAAGNVLDSSKFADNLSAYLRKWNC